MNINQFKEEDIITRIEPVFYGGQNERGDGSYIGDRIIFCGHDPKTKIIFIKTELLNEPHSLSYGRDKWDEGWEYYPESLWQRVKKEFGKLTSLSQNKNIKEE